MTTKIEIKSIFGDLLFSYDCEENTIKKTVEEALKEKINLQLSDLSGSDLRSSDLRNSDLSGQRLIGQQKQKARISTNFLQMEQLYYWWQNTNWLQN